jgi:hypothetical protein
MLAINGNAGRAIMAVEFIPVDRDKPLPASIEASLPADHLARFVVEIVERLDLSRLSLRVARPTTRP